MTLHPAVECASLTSVYYRVLMDLVTHGTICSPRGQRTKELLGYNVRLTNSRANLLASPTRNLSQRYAIAEWLWITFGRNDVNTIVPFNKHLAKFSDDGERFFGAYGPMVKEQWSYAKTRLESDESTRQAVIQIWRPRPGETKDTPCTLSLQFFVRKNHLHLITTMRSNDAWLGLPYDVFTFTQLQQEMAQQLGLDAGWYQHNVGSMHLYEEHWPLANKVIEEMAWQLENNVLPPENYVWQDNMPMMLEPTFIAMGQGPECSREFAKRAFIEDLVNNGIEVPWSIYMAVLTRRLIDKVNPRPGIYGTLYDVQQRTKEACP